MTNERRQMGFKEQYFDIWQQVWSLHKKYYVIQEQDEKRWKQLNEPPRQHSLDRFQQWSMKVIEESKNQKGDHENEKKEIEETADLLRPGFSRLGGISYLTGSVR